MLQYFSLGFDITAFLFLFSLMIVLGIPCSLGMTWVPSVIREIFPYGKNSDGILQSSIIKAILVPKRWFSHFYLFAFLYTLVAVNVLFAKYVFHREIPETLQTYLNFVSNPRDRSQTDAASALLATFLFFIHLGRRFYESLMVNVFSDAKMNLVHYFSGYLHYWGCTTVLLSYAPDLDEMNGMQMRYRHIAGILLFLFGSYNQFSAHSKLASFRKDPRDRQRYFVAKGGLFEYVSCPNFLCESVIYVALHIVLGAAHHPWTLITLWVTTNQTLAAKMAHEWYLRKFNDYPDRRRAIFPFVY